MCSVSAISDYYRDRTQGPQINPWPAPGTLQQQFPPIPQWDPEAKQLLREVLERLDKLDKRLGDLECHDESKAELKRQLGMEETAAKAATKTP